MTEAAPDHDDSYECVENAFAVNRRSDPPAQGLGVGLVIHYRKETNGAMIQNFTNGLFQVTQDVVQWKDFMNTVMKFLLPNKRRIYYISE
jgi:hypothetical protein